jgi:riboflavin biosynthesis pyrimidine reductase
MGVIMAELYKFEFPKDIKMTRIFENRELLGKLRASSWEKEILPSVKRVYDGELFFPAPYEDRPYIYCSLVCSLDGRIAFEDAPVSTYLARNNYLDKEGGIINFWSLMMQRTHADGAITAAKTLLSEPEGTLHICDSEMIKERINILKKSNKHPLNIVVSRSGTGIPFNHKIFNSLSDENLHVIIATTRKGKERLAQTKNKKFAFVEVETRDDIKQIQELKLLSEATDIKVCPVLVVGKYNEEIDTKLFMWILRQIGINRLFVEAPQYMYHLIQEQILDEFFMDFSMLFAGGSIVAGSRFEFKSNLHPHTELINVAIHKQNFLYTRHRMVYSCP